MRRYATPRYIPALTRTFSASSRVLQKPQPSRYNFNPEPSFEETPAEQALRYPTLTAHDLFQLKEQPKGVKMLTRDFIEDSLYNPNYGYFSKEAIIFSDSSPDKGFDFPSLRDANAFQSAMAESYQNYADSGAIKGPGHQVWHTPTELFKVRTRHLRCSPSLCTDFMEALLRTSHRPVFDLRISSQVLPIRRLYHL